MDTLRIAGGQLDLTVGDLEGNRARIATAMEWAEDRGADVLLLPELAVTGYPPDDLLLRPDFIDENLAVLESLAEHSGETVSVVGFVDRAEEEPPRLDDARPRNVANAVALLCRGQVRGIYHKALLPNYGVFDEDRYFVPGGAETVLFDIAGMAVGVSVCEDIWVPDGPPSLQANAGARLLLNVNGSPYHIGKGEERASLLSGQAARFGLPLVYVNRVGGQDELVFDGQSMIFDSAGRLVFRARQFVEQMFVVDLPLPSTGDVGPVIPARPEPRVEQPNVPAPEVAEALTEDEEGYTAVVPALGDYVRKNGFREVVIGLSGGIDSALTAALAVDALGPDSVWGVAMPSPYSSEGSVRDAEDLTKRLGCRFSVLGIDDAFAAYRRLLAPHFEGTESGVAEENLQARIRGAVLMALSNKFGGMVAATGNKSEMAVGYATLYGDMVGGYAVLKDVLKTRVYRLARWRNAKGEVIPPASIEKPPSAELRPDQLDSDSLPPYEVLDPILEAYVERDESVQQIVSTGAVLDTVIRVTTLFDNNEYKRRQAPPGVKITKKAFGKDRRLAITRRGLTER